MNDEELSTAIAEQLYEKVTKDSIENRIINVSYTVLPDSTVTIANLKLENGFSVRGESACVDPRNFNMQIGQELAYRDAFRKMWELEGYLLAENRWRQEVFTKVED